MQPAPRDPFSDAQTIVRPLAKMGVVTIDVLFGLGVTTDVLLLAILEGWRRQMCCQSF